MAGTVQDVLTAIRGLDSRLQEEAMKSLFMAYRGVPGVSSGRSFNDDVNLAASCDAAGQGSGSAGQVSLPGVDSMFGFVGEPYAIPSFTMFQDPNVSADEDSPWICFHPSVTVGDVSVGVAEPDGYESGNTYYCHVYRSGSDWKAVINNEPKTAEGDPDSRVSVKIAKLPADSSDDPVEQYHVGTIVVGGVGGGWKFLASFAVYEGAAGLTMFDPVVACPPDTTLTPSVPNPLLAGTYYCHVWRDGEWVYHSNIDTSKSHSGSGKPVLDVKICDIVNGADKKPVLSKQYHVGVICADARTGLRVKSAGSLLTSNMGAGQTGDVSRKVELEFTEKLTKHLAMTVTATGDGKDGATIKLDEDDSVKGTTVVTGFKSLTVGGGKLRLVASTAKIRFPIIEGSEGEATVEMAVSETPVVVGSEYNESTGKFTNATRNVTVLAKGGETPDEVFTAVKFPECPSLNNG